MKIVVTGALGHIGSRLIRVLPQNFKGTHFVLLDNFLTQRYCSLFDLPSEGSFRFIQGDILKYNLDSILEEGDVVVHLAAITDAANSFDKQKEVENVNLVGTQKVAEACLRKKAKLIFLSTTSVYGTQESLVDENCSLDELKPQSPYAESKLAAEVFLSSLGKEGLQHCSLRFGTIFGTSIGMRFHTAINKFCFQAIMGDALTVWKTALDQYRPYLDLEDGVRAIEHVIKKDLFQREVYNVLTLNATVRQMVDVIKERYPETKIDLVETKIMNQLSYKVSPRKFAATGFESSGDLGSSINRTLDLLAASNNAI